MRGNLKKILFSHEKLLMHSPVTVPGHLKGSDTLLPDRQHLHLNARSDNKFNELIVIKFLYTAPYY